VEFTSLPNQGQNEFAIPPVEVRAINAHQTEAKQTVCFIKKTKKQKLEIENQTENSKKIENRKS
jgi:hypothetical protein